jgi:4-amino-4-deoxy-L-arabinose transferase-like glycosyltransferase
MFATHPRKYVLDCLIVYAGLFQRRCDLTRILSRTLILDLVLLGLLYSAFAVTYLFIVPVYDSPDEPAHMFYVEFIAQHWSLPNQNVPALSVTNNMAVHPLLYYALLALALVISGFNNWSPNITAQGDWIHGEWPFARSIYTALSLRLASVLSGAATVILTYLLVLEIFRERRWLALSTAGFVALIPQFQFIGSIVNPNAFESALSTACLFLFVRVGKSRRPRLVELVGPSVAVALLLLTGFSGFVMLVPLVILILTREFPAFQKIKYALTCAVLIVAISAWWYARNFILYGDPFAWSVVHRTQPATALPLVSYSMINVFPKALLNSYWAEFGWRTFQPFFLSQWFFYSILAVGIAGFSLGLPRLLSSIAKAQKLQLGMVVGYAALLFVAAIDVVKTLGSYELPGRYLFPSIAPIAMILGVGWQQITASFVARRKRLMFVGLVLLAFVNLCVILDLYLNYYLCQRSHVCYF